ELRDLDYPLLAELKSHKDASVEDIINLLRLEGPLAEAPASVITRGTTSDLIKESPLASEACVQEWWEEYEEITNRSDAPTVRTLGPVIESAGAPLSCSGVAETEELSVIATAKVSHFEILCRIYGFVPTVEMDLFTFIQVANPTKVKVGERKRVEGEARLLDSTIRRVVSLLPVAPARSKSELEAKTKRGHGASSEAATSGKSPTVLRELLARSMLNVEAGVATVATLPMVTSSVSATPEHESGPPTDSTRTVKPAATGSSHAPGKELSMGSRYIN
nr:hypothetical protein [Tanacetum cinerariifolium]